MRGKVRRRDNDLGNTKWTKRNELLRVMRIGENTNLPKRKPKYNHLNQTAVTREQSWNTQFLLMSVVLVTKKLDQLLVGIPDFFFELVLDIPIFSTYPRMSERQKVGGP